MTKVRLKLPFLLLLVMALVVLPFLTMKFVSNDLKEEEADYTIDEVIESDVPVVNTTTIINPYLDQSVTIKKGYYDYKAEEKNQVDSIIKHDDTYIQNKGIDYVGDNVFDVIAILNGTVSSVKEDEELGKTVEIKHDNGMISIYQSLSEVNVKKGDIISQGYVIGKSGENKLDKDLGNHLHFEIYNNGSSVNPLNYLNTEVSLEKEN
ncbi:MAG: M23 family metallopeptidase [Bacilli bacterium]|nr:M23 family metallopeptidase [Bacilli bacterium]